MAKEACGKGHQFTEENTYVRPDGYRHCRTCVRQAKFRYREKNGIKPRRTVNGYFAVHKRMLKLERGPCVDCGGPSNHWSLKPTCPPSHLMYDETGLRFSYNADDYEPRCRRCHMILDGTTQNGGKRNAAKTHCAQGHEFTLENTKPQKGGRGRACRTCHRLNGRRRYFANLEASRARARLHAKASYERKKAKMGGA